MRGQRTNSFVNCLSDLAALSSISHDFVTGKPRDLIPLHCQRLVAALIMLAAFVGLMIRTIDFKNQLRRTQRKSTV